MTLQTRIESNDVKLSAVSERRIDHQLDALGKRLKLRPSPAATLVLRHSGPANDALAELRVHLGPRGRLLVSTRTAPTPEAATRLAVEDVERQLERQLARQRGEASFGVPSRREPPPSG